MMAFQMLYRDRLGMEVTYESRIKPLDNAQRKSAITFRLGILVGLIQYDCLSSGGRINEYKKMCLSSDDRNSATCYTNRVCSR